MPSLPILPAAVRRGRRSWAGLLRRWLLRPEYVPLLPALLLGGFWFGGEMVMVIAAVAFPALFLLDRQRGAARPAPVRGGDPATGLPLRPEMEARVDEILAAGREGGLGTVVFAIGIDAFDPLADRLGPETCAEFLRRTGERLAAVLRREDVLARLEGAAFAAAFAPVARADLETALQTAARLQAAVAEPLILGDRRVVATASVGFCLGTRAPSGGGAALMSAARDALDLAQAAGPGSVRAHVPGTPPAAARRAARDAEVTAALERGQIRPWFQPQLAAASRQISGFEALARWEHPERGPIGPAEFLPALSAAGLMERLGDVMLFQGLTALRAWDRAGHAVPSLGINVSAEELGNPRFAEKLAWDLDRFDIAPGRLSVEIVETVVAGGGDECAVRSIAALRRLGCRIDLDDFGTGAASITALQRFAVSRIKIDRSFIAGLDEDKDQQRVVAAILGLADRMGLDTLAEGVERVGEHAILARLGCGHVQGFGIARPMRFEDTAGWITRHAERLAAAPGPLRRAG